MIYFVEDDENIRKLVCYALTKEGYQVQGFPAPGDFWTAMTGSLPELILLDIMLPEEDGLSVLQKLRDNSRTADIPVMMLTAKGSEFDKVTGLDLGADDYMIKPFGMTELVARVRALLRRSGRESVNAEKTYRLGSLYVNPEKHLIEVGGETVPLSYKEYCLLLVLLEAKGKVVKRDELLSRVWGEFYEESRTLDVHIRKLRVKLKDAGALIRTIKNIGYQMGEEKQA
ncbi:MAG: response regulator transcription factor [Clostridia bacterium]|nr:response regulator transcription factor [Clostridia bacterium]